MRSLSMLVITAHPDDEALGLGGTIARYAADGVAVSLITATRGDRGRWHGLPLGQQGHPGAEAVATAREAELRRAAAVLGVQHLEVMDYGDGQLDRSDRHDIVRRLARQIRAMRPDVIVTFGPDGAYGHPDHIAISQFVCAAVVAAATTAPGYAEAPHMVSKLYFLASPEAAWAAYQAAFKTLFAVTMRGSGEAPVAGLGITPGLKVPISGAATEPPRCRRRGWVPRFWASISPGIRWTPATSGHGRQDSRTVDFSTVTRAA
jgi:LmbE family N-acetylglucosaminyl deacetylase